MSDMECTKKKTTAKNTREVTNLTPEEQHDDKTRAGVSETWEQIWADGLEPGQRFDARGPAPILKHLLDTNALPKGRALVPGCGRAYAPLEFARHGYQTLGVDLAHTAVKAAQEFVDSVEDKPKEGLLELRAANFFELEGQFDVIYDYTFLCALHPNAREKWAAQMHKLLAPQGELVTLIFPIVEKEGGPPYAMSMDLVKSLLEPLGFTATTLEMLPDDMCHRGREERTALGRWVKK
ncbi:hypothetical protein PTSG_00628 [Salpingoeca rosetta]|uniref:Thiopurine S-methyltransferase n=1 Tax=Salpingoeca rosetta (strain ATCC 50818 / BSB-021) TaxID=946362 RepID=F2TX11_SALR5|nr:uncharacterized protein PTSG_00628 [Salpingoeca rosetta]EGD75920.1 hypothetical protein PTSG_00628 [Salpingoeca rosetta]|eukprot:XP_004998096.1 hypothetical protein PTSG_00628 [Salpingoeca rosetta]